MFWWFSGALILMAFFSFSSERRYSTPARKVYNISILETLFIRLFKNVLCYETKVGICEKFAKM